MPRQLLSRPRLLAGAEALRDCQAILLQAPAGFGKTSLAAQWRLEHVARGSSVAWVSLPNNLSQVEAAVFRVTLPYETPWIVSLAVITGVIALACLVLERRVRAVEIVT